MSEVASDCAVPMAPRRSPNEERVTPVEGARVYSDLVAMRGPYTHEQHVKLIGIAMRHELLPDGDAKAFLDIREPTKFQAICIQLHTVLLESLAHYAVAPEASDVKDQDIAAGAVEVQKGVGQIIPPRS